MVFEKYTIQKYYYSRQSLNVYDQSKLDDIARDVEILTDAERLERTMGNLISIIWFFKNYEKVLNSRDQVFFQSFLSRRMFIIRCINFIFAAECGECLIYYPNVTNFEKITLEVDRAIALNFVFIKIFYET